MDIDPVRRQSLISIVSTICLTALGFLATMYFAHVLGTELYGVYALFLAYYGIFNLIGDGGFGGAAIKRISEGREREEYFTAFLTLRVFLLTISVLLLLLIRPFIEGLEGDEIFFWLILALIIAVFAGITGNGVYGEGKVGVRQTGILLTSLVKIIVQMVTIFFGFSVAGLFGGFVTGIFIGGLFNLRFLTLSLTKFNWGHIHNLITFSFWIFLTSSGAIIFSYADTIIISYFLNLSDIGIYRIAFQFAATATLITTALRTVLYPKISQWHTEGFLERISNSLTRAFTYSLLLAVPVTVGGWILGEHLLYFFYGASFTEGADVLGILLLVQIVNVFMFLQTMCLNAINRPRESFYATGIAATINIALDLALIPLLGVQGAAIATLITMIVNAIIAYHYLSKQISVHIERGPTFHILLAAGAMALVIVLYKFFIPLTNIFLVLTAVAIGGIFYSLVLLKTDNGLHNEIRELVIQLGAPWPKWL